MTESPAASARTGVLVILGGLGLMAAIALAMWDEPTDDAPTAVYVQPPEATSLAAAPTQVAAVAPPDDDAARRQELARIAKSDIWKQLPTPPAATPIAAPEPARTEAVPVPPPPPVLPRALAVEQQRREQEAMRDRQRHTEIAAQLARQSKEHERALQAAALSEARRKVRVEVYTAARCTNCRQAIAYLARQTEVRYTLHDINSDLSARDRLNKINPAQSVPTLAVDDVVLIGFSPRAFDAALDNAARKRARL